MIQNNTNSNNIPPVNTLPIPLSSITPELISTYNQGLDKIDFGININHCYLTTNHKLRYRYLKEVKPNPLFCKFLNEKTGKVEVRSVEFMKYDSTNFSLELKRHFNTIKLYIKSNIPIYLNGHNVLLFDDCTKNKEFIDWILWKLQDIGIVLKNRDALEISYLEYGKIILVDYPVETYLPFFEINHKRHYKRKTPFNNSYYFENKTSVVNTYSKLDEVQDNPDYAFKIGNFNVLKPELRIKGNKGLTSFSKTYSVDLRNVNSICNPVKFNKIKKMYLKEMNKLLPLSSRPYLIDKSKYRFYELLFRDTIDKNTEKKLFRKEVQIDLLLLSSGVSLNELSLLKYPSNSKTDRVARSRFRNEQMPEWINKYAKYLREDNPYNELKQKLNNKYKPINIYDYAKHICGYVEVVYDSNGNIDMEKTFL